MTRRIGTWLVAAIVGGIIGSGALLLVRRSHSTTERTAPEIVRALRASAGEWCPDKDTDSSGTINYSLVAPVRSGDGNWYTGCRVVVVDPKLGGVTFYCYRVKPDTLEVIALARPKPLPANRLGYSCDKYPDWPKP